VKIGKRELAKCKTLNGPTFARNPIGIYTSVTPHIRKRNFEVLSRCLSLFIRIIRPASVRSKRKISAP